MKQPRKFTRREKEIVSANGYNPNDYMYVSETLIGFSIISKDGKKVVRNVDSSKRKKHNA